MQVNLKGKEAFERKGEADFGRARSVKDARGAGKEMGGRMKKKKKQWLVSKGSPPLSSPGRSRASLFLLFHFPPFRPSPFELRMPRWLKQLLPLSFGVYFLLWIFLFTGKKTNGFPRNEFDW